MRRPVRVMIVVGLIVAATLAVVGARGKDPAGEPTLPAPTTPAATPARAGGLVRVEPAMVCMVNDRDMQVAQIPVDFEGRRYYGCCPMCKEKLASDASVRNAKDPVSGRTVDKSKAVIGTLPDGRVLYFESDQTFARYVAAPGGKALPQ
jgi:YHS domain-containing protein